MEAPANQPLHLTRRHYGFSEFNVSPAAAQVNGVVRVVEDSFPSGAAKANLRQHWRAPSMWRVYVCSGLIALCCGSLAAVITVEVALRLFSAPPADQFKAISDGKKNQLTQFLESKQSRLFEYEATVTEEPNIERRGDHTHVGVIRFKYTVTKPAGEGQAQILHIAKAEYVFSAKEKRWVCNGCFLEQGGGFQEHKEGPLVNFPDIKAAFEK